MNALPLIDGYYFRRFAAVGCFTLWVSILCFGQTPQLRNRGEDYSNLITSNTAGAGDIWLRMGAIGGIWDKVPGEDGVHHWMSNFRPFPEIQAQTGLFNFAMVTIDSRPASWGSQLHPIVIKPGWVSGDLKVTPPDNSTLRINGFAFDLKYQHNFPYSGATLGYNDNHDEDVQVMPEGFIMKGNTIEGKFVYELDLISVASELPLRFILNGGVRMPFDNSLRQFSQVLGAAGLLLNGYGYDFYAMYNIEAFTKFFGGTDFLGSRTITLDPAIPQANFRMYFSDNPMYLTLGANLRYENGIVLSGSIPLLLSYSPEPAITRWGQPVFDPGFVKWEIAGSISFPLHSTISSSEMTRNFLLMKNRKVRRQLDIENHLPSPENRTPQPDTASDKQKQFDKIQKD